MTETLALAREDLRSSLNEVTQAYFLDTDLNNWLNEGCRVIARKANALQEKSSINVQGGNPQYAGPTNIIRIHRAEYLPADSQNTYPLEIRLYSEMESIWGSNQLIEQYYPSFLTTWREPPNTNIVLFPVPSSVGVLQIFYYRMPNPATADGTALDCPTGWEDLAIQWALSKALFKAQDPRWSQMRQDFMANLADLADIAQSYTDAVGRMTPPSGIGPLWQFGGGMDQGWY